MGQKRRFEYASGVARTQVYRLSFSAYRQSHRGFAGEAVETLRVDAMCLGLTYLAKNGHELDGLSLSGWSGLGSRFYVFVKRG